MGRDNRADQLISEIRLLATHDDAGGALQRICMLLRARVEHYDWVGYYLAVPGERTFVLGPFEGAPTEHLRIPYGNGVCGRAAETGSALVIPDVRAESNYLACSLETRAEIVLPVFHNGQLVGELDIDSHTLDPFTDFDEQLLEEVGSMTAELVAGLSEELRTTVRAAGPDRGA